MGLQENSPLESQLDGYSKISKTALKKSPTLGVAVAAFAIGTNESEATIMVTNVNLQIPNAGVSTILDITGFGAVADFEFQIDNATSNFVRMGARAGHRVQGRSSGGYNYASRLSSGASVGAAGSAGFLADTGPANDKYLAFSYSAGAQGGDWFGGATGFIGIRVVTGVDVNYGWMEVTVNADNISGEIIRYAIESTPDTPIEAGAVPEPNSLACLAVGAVGLLRWRRRNKAA